MLWVVIILAVWFYIMEIDIETDTFTWKKDRFSIDISYKKLQK